MERLVQSVTGNCYHSVMECLGNIVIDRCFLECDGQHGSECDGQLGHNVMGSWCQSVMDSWHHSVIYSWGHNVMDTWVHRDGQLLS